MVSRRGESCILGVLISWSCKHMVPGSNNEYTPRSTKCITFSHLELWLWYSMCCCVRSIETTWISHLVVQFVILCEDHYMGNGNSFIFFEMPNFFKQCQQVCKFMSHIVVTRKLLVHPTENAKQAKCFYIYFMMIIINTLQQTSFINHPLLFLLVSINTTMKITIKSPSHTL